MNEKKLSEIAVLLNGYAFKSKNYVDAGIRIIRIANVQDGYIMDEAPCFYPIDTEEDIQKYTLYAGDLLISLTGNVGRVGVLPAGMLPAALNQRVCCLRIDESLVDRKYLFYYLRQYRFMRDCVKASKGVAQLNLSTKWLADYEIFLPALSEQKRIVARIEELFSELDNGVETLQKTKQQLAVYRQAVLKSAFCDIPTDKYKVLRSVLSSSPQNGLYKPKTAYGSGTRILRIDGFYDGRISDDYDFKRLNLSESEIEQYQLNKGDLVINRVNSMPYLGKCALIRELPEATVYESNMMRMRFDDTIVDPEYVTYYLSSFSGRKELTKNAKQAVNQASINQTDVGNALIPVPESMEKQKSVVSAINASMSVCDSIENTVDTALQQAEAMRQSILKQAFEGRA